MKYTQYHTNINCFLQLRLYLKHLRLWSAAWNPKTEEKNYAMLYKWCKYKAFCKFLSKDTEKGCKMKRLKNVWSIWKVCWLLLKLPESLEANSEDIHWWNNFQRTVSKLKHVFPCSLLIKIILCHTFAPFWCLLVTCWLFLSLLVTS